MQAKKKKSLLARVLTPMLLVIFFVGGVIFSSAVTSMSALQKYQTNAQQASQKVVDMRALKPPATYTKEICVDSNVIAPQGLGDIVLRLRPAIIMGEILGATIRSPRVDTYHGYSTTEMLGLEPCDPAPVFRECI
jgi:hypothetical protein